MEQWRIQAFAGTIIATVLCGIVSHNYPDIWFLPPLLGYIAGLFTGLGIFWPGPLSH